MNYFISVMLLTLFPSLAFGQAYSCSSEAVIFNANDIIVAEDSLEVGVIGYNEEGLLIGLVDYVHEIEGTEFKFSAQAAEYGGQFEDEYTKPEVGIDYFSGHFTLDDPDEWPLIESASVYFRDLENLPDEVILESSWSDGKLSDERSVFFRLHCLLIRKWEP